MPTPPPSYSFSTEATEYGVRKSYYLTNQEGSAEVENLHVKGTLEVDGATTLTTVTATGISVPAGDISAPTGTVTGSTLVGGSLSVAGDSIVNATNTSGAGLNVGGVAGAVNMSVPLLTKQNFQVVSASSLTTAGAITCAGPLSVQNVGITTPASITSSIYSNSSILTHVAIQVVQNGVGVNGATLGAPNPGGPAFSGGLLTLPLLTIFPGCGNFKSFKLFLSGSETDKYANIITAYSGNNSDTSIDKQMQSVTTYGFKNNYKGQVQSRLNSAFQGPGDIQTFPESLIVVPGDGGTTLYQYFGTSTGASIGYNSGNSQVWLHFYPIL